MAIRGVDHINIGTTQLEATVAFFRDAIGLELGWRPDFPFGGAWLYAGDTAVVHLVDLPQSKLPSNEAALDHFALRIDDYDAAIARLDAVGVRYRAVDIPNTPIRQINVRDPNGVNIELNYRPGLSASASTAASAEA
ncbi:MAG TPA: VOC family protein [Caulobacteraceae bacterium]|jgi:catechol 2,3-dioxygenase-like lactoylglutathione lyase family enzyme|nr:VOC family protein [Caulobacteraceae bacterium]